MKGLLPLCAITAFDAPHGPFESTLCTISMDDCCILRCESQKISSPQMQCEFISNHVNQVQQAHPRISCIFIVEGGYGYAEVEAMHISSFLRNIPCVIMHNEREHSYGVLPHSRTNPLHIVSDELGIMFDAAVPTETKNTFMTQMRENKHDQYSMIRTFSLAAHWKNKLAK